MVTQETGADGPLDAVVIDGKKRPDAKPGGEGLQPDKLPQKDMTYCPPTAAIITNASSSGAWKLALASSPKLTISPVVILTPKAKEAMLAFDHADEASSFVFSYPTSASSLTKVAQAVTGAVSSFAKATGADLKQASGGIRVTSHDGHPALIYMRLVLGVSKGQKPPDVRTALLPYLLARPSSQMATPKTVKYANGNSNTFILGLSIVLRVKESRYLVVGSVADSGRVADHSKRTSVIIDDLTNGTALAGPKAALDSACYTAALTGNQPMADIVWVMDESGSMNTKNTLVSSKADAIFSLANKYRLDFRMGVTGMIPPPTAGTTPITGKLCADGNGAKDSAGGQDRFLLPGEKKTFQDCLENPPYLMTGSEYGLTNAFHAVTKHLPRKPASAKDKTRIRKEATLALIIVTDEGPVELKSSGTWKGTKGFLDYTDFKQGTCALGATKESALDTFIQDWLKLYGGKHATHGKEATATINLIGEVCFETCSSSMEVPWGYQEIGRGSGGQVGSLCQSDLWLSLGQMIEDTAGAASPMELTHAPISASLAMRLDATTLSRSRKKGFDFRAASRTLVLVDYDYKKGAKVAAAYRYWK